MLLQYAVRSHVGKVRGRNEDNFYADSLILPEGEASRSFSLDKTVRTNSVLAVCDGLGGEEAGDMASRSAAQGIGLWSDRLLKASSGHLSASVDACVRDINEVIHKNARQLQRSRVGTTMALAVIKDSGVFCFNEGDSPIYAMKKGVLERVTHDHNLRADMIRRGADPDNILEGAENMLTRCLGIGEDQPAEAYPPIRGNVRLLLCSDGLTKMVSDEQITAFLRDLKEPARAADALLKEALDKGGRDNITLIVADVRPSTGLKALFSR